jgi:hypothetical protein
LGYDIENLRETALLNYLPYIPSTREFRFMPNRSTCLMVSLLGVLVSASSVIVGQDETRLEPRHVAQIKYLAAAVLSPDGKHAAYTVTRPRRPLKDKDGRAWQELYVTDFDNSRPFITGEVSVGSPQWSADGRSIYYLAKRTGDDHTVLYRIPVDGGESVRVLKHPTSISAFDIAPDGTSVAFLAHQEQAKSTKELRQELRVPGPSRDDQVFGPICSFRRGNRDSFAIGGPILDGLLGADVRAVAESHMTVAGDGKLTSQEPSLVVEQGIRASGQVLKLRITVCQRGCVQHLDLRSLALGLGRRQLLVDSEVQPAALMEDLMTAVLLERLPVFVCPADQWFIGPAEVGRHFRLP